MSAEPIVELMYHLVLEEDYWFLRIAHRHHAGRFGDCPHDNYPRLTAGEAIDVMVVETELMLEVPDDDGFDYCPVELPA